MQVRKETYGAYHVMEAGVRSSFDVSFPEGTIGIGYAAVVLVDMEGSRKYKWNSYHRFISGGAADPGPGAVSGFSGIHGRMYYHLSLSRDVGRLCRCIFCLRCVHKKCISRFWIVLPADGADRSC